MEIRVYTADRTKEIAKLFHHSVHAIDSTIYSNEQKEAWAPTPPNYHQWQLKLSRVKTYLAIIGGKVAGFIQLRSDGYIDCLYTHPQFQDSGVASLLYCNIEILAKGWELERLFVKASVIAKPFFKRRGFSVYKSNKMTKSGQILINYSMEKCLIDNNLIQPNQSDCNQRGWVTPLIS